MEQILEQIYKELKQASVHATSKVNIHRKQKNKTFDQWSYWNGVKLTVDLFLEKIERMEKDATTESNDQSLESQSK